MWISFHITCAQVNQSVPVLGVTRWGRGALPAAPPPTLRHLLQSEVGLSLVWSSRVNSFCFLLLKVRRLGVLLIWDQLHGPPAVRVAVTRSLSVGLCSSVRSATLTTNVCLLHQAPPWFSTQSLRRQGAGPDFRCGEWRVWTWFLFLRASTGASTAETRTWSSTPPPPAEEASSMTCTSGKVALPKLTLNNPN